MRLTHWNWIGLALALAGVCGAAESFEGAPAGGFLRLETAAGVWSAEAGAAAVHAGHAKEGRHSLRVSGGGERAVELALPKGLTKPGRLGFWAERWTARGPFGFRIDAAVGNAGFEEIWNGDAVVKVGGFLTFVEIPLPAGTERLRVRCTSPENSGVMLDLVEIVEDAPMRLAGIEVTQPVTPVMKGRAENPVIGLRIVTEGGLEPLVLEAVEVEMTGTTQPGEIEAVAVLAGGADPSGGFGEGFGAPQGAARGVFSGRRELVRGDNWWWVSVRLKDGADLDGVVDARVVRVKISGRVIDVAEGSPAGVQRIGVALRRLGDDGAKAYRIPGLVRTNAGSLVAAYDIRYQGAADLPADIDVGVSRSTDGGRSWEPMRVAIDMGPGAGNGVGDPCIFVDRQTGRIWLAALWSQGNRAWHGSGPGLEPRETGQLVLAHSDDDGRTWSAPRNLTKDVKDPAWRLLLCGPGTGITMADGTLVFPAQFRAADGRPWSTLIASKDRGETWTIGTGVKSDTTEAQLVEVEPGVILINCRDDRGGSRTIATTADLGRTWQPHATDRKALPESVCMASLLKWEVPGAGTRLFFSNPATTRGRHTMTVKVSADLGMSWPERLHTIYDQRSGFGYSCLAPVDDARLGVLYEGAGELLFLRLPVAGLLEGGSAERKVE